MGEDREPHKAGGPPDIDGAHDALVIDVHEDEILRRYGIAFRQFMNEAREIEKTYLQKTKRRAEDIRAAAVYIRRSLENAARKVGGFDLGAIPVPLKLIFNGLNDVQAGHYSRALSPSLHDFGQSYKTQDRLMTIGHALAIWDVLKDLGIKSTVARDRVVSALNDAGFRIPKTKKSDSRQTTGEVTTNAIEQWRKRARRGEGPYSGIYNSARKDLKALLGTLPVEEDQELTADELIAYLKRYVSAHRIDG